ncbi:MAG: hypothetical protein WD513_02260 [Balneolaceae bacterium]
MRSEKNQLHDRTDEKTRSSEKEKRVENTSSSVLSYNKEKSLPDDSISSRLASLPVVKVKPGFDQKMAALFALELEEEIRRKCFSWQIKTNKIRLPDLITDLRSEFF